MFFSKCKKCGGRRVSAAAEFEFEIDGNTRRVRNVPAKQCVKCGDIVIHDMILERLRRYAREYPSNPLDYAECEDEESAAAQVLL